MLRKIIFIWMSCGLFIACSRKTALDIAWPESIPTVQIHGLRTGMGPCEPSIDIDPSNPDRMVAGAVLDNVYHSIDGGRTWQVDRLKSPFGVFGDPVVRFDTKGSVFYAHLANPGGRAYRDDEFLDRIVVQKSMDGGRTWNEGTHPAIREGKDQDKQWLYMDPADGSILMSWTEFDVYGSKDPAHKSRILFSRSADQGKTWSDPLAISQLEGDCMDDDMTTEGAVPVADITGRYYVAWAYNSRIYLDVSEDQGETWMDEDRVVASQVNGWSQNISGIDRCNGMPVLGTDISQGPYRGRLYINFTDQRNGEDDTDVWLIYSDDLGVTWSDPVRVNDDPPGRHQFFTWMDVDPVTGIIYIVFYDRRQTQGDATNVYLAYSGDGGKTFVNRKINKDPFIPTAGVFFGDYNDISAYNNRVRPIWTRLEGRQLSIWTALVEMSVGR